MEYNRPSGFSVLPEVVKNLLIINGLMYLLAFTLENTMGLALYRILGLFYFGSEYFAPYQVVSHMFMHGSLMHLLFNMFALWMFGSALENLWGSKRFFIFYFVTGLGAAALHMGVQAWQVYQLTGGWQVYTGLPVTGPEVAQKLQQINFVPTVGASGAIYGLLMAFGLIFPNVRLLFLFFPVPIKAKYFVMIFIVMELGLGLARLPGDQIAHFAHLGGMVFGYLLIKYWKR